MPNAGCHATLCACTVSPVAWHASAVAEMVAVARANAMGMTRQKTECPSWPPCKSVPFTGIGVHVLWLVSTCIVTFPGAHIASSAGARDGPSRMQASRASGHSTDPHAILTSRETIALVGWMRAAVLTSGTSSVAPPHWPAPYCRGSTRVCDGFLKPRDQCADGQFDQEL